MEVPRGRLRARLEGVVCKHKLATYGVDGPGGWFKVSNSEYTQKRGRREMFDSFRGARRWCAANLVPVNHKRKARC